MKYTIKIHGDCSDNDSHICELSKKEAAKEASALAKTGNTVFVTWYRKADGQHGYLNRDGHSPVGKAW